jgi:hypothetical protein
MLPWMPMSFPSPCFSSATYSVAEPSTVLELAHSSLSGRLVKTCLGVLLMKLAKGWTSESGQYPTQ